MAAVAGSPLRGRRPKCESALRRPNGEARRGRGRGWRTRPVTFRPWRPLVRCPVERCPAVGFFFFFKDDDDDDSVFAGSRRRSGYVLFHTLRHAAPHYNRRVASRRLERIADSVDPAIRKRTRIRVRAFVYYGFKFQIKRAISTYIYETTM